MHQARRSKEILMVVGNARDGAGGEYAWESSRPAHNHSYLLPALLDVLGPASGRTLLDVGCGNGALTAKLAEQGFACTGLEHAQSGLKQASASFPDVTFDEHDVNEPLPVQLRGRFDVVLAAEVIEHLFLPRSLFARAEEALAPGGTLVVTTPFHGYLKNLALAVANKYDHHWRPGWDYGHIKFFSRKTLGVMAADMGWRPVDWKLIGRIPQLAKTMILVAERRSPPG
jgi:2-polyprenyl-3-methyl-5-hydroxy-6-metoxy-1,4-benzoquinol methylase